MHHYIAISNTLVQHSYTLKAIILNVLANFCSDLCDAYSKQFSKTIVERLDLIPVQILLRQNEINENCIALFLARGSRFWCQFGCLLLWWIEIKYIKRGWGSMVQSLPLITREPSNQAVIKVTFCCLVQISGNSLNKPNEPTNDHTTQLPMYLFTTIFLRQIRKFS